MPTADGCYRVVGSDCRRAVRTHAAQGALEGMLASGALSRAIAERCRGFDLREWEMTCRDRRVFTDEFARGGEQTGTPALIEAAD